MSSTKPEILVGIDFGMTFTGVAYSRIHMPQPKVIQKWPTRAHESNRKVPTVLHYPEFGDLPDWGFSCQYKDGKQEWFKRYLDPEYLESMRGEVPDGGLPQIAEVRKWYRDYMRCLYTYISRFLQDQMGDWSALRVEFIFSLPTTFRSQDISTTLREELRQAGFGRGAYHTIDFGLTEPQASAVDAAKYSSKTFEGGDVIFVCDAGGGTTDFALLEQTTARGARPELRELASVPGIDVGSTNIDTAFETLVDLRLRAGGLHLAENTSWTMMHSQEFQMWKCSFGDPSTDDVPRFLVTVPFLDESISNREAGIERGKMSFSHADLRQLFDPQVAEIVRVIRQQLDRMVQFQTHPGKHVKYLILSGGLGSSPYLLKRLRTEFMHSSHQAAPHLDILVSDEPQLAVCRGLVIDRMQRITSRRNVLVGRICPASYGVLCDMPYDKNNPQHVNQSTYRDPINGLPYVRNQVVWMIRKGQMIDVDNHIAHNFTKIVGKLKEEGVSDDSSNKKIWRNRVVISYSDAHRLPSNSGHADCFVLCNITSNLSSVPMSEFEVVKERKSWYKKIGSRDKYRIAEHEVRVVIGSTDIKFELWFKGEQYTRPNSIRVEWQEGASVAAPNENRRLDSNILDGIRKRKAMKSVSGRERDRTARDLRNDLRSPRRFEQ